MNYDPYQNIREEAWLFLGDCSRPRPPSTDDTFDDTFLIGQLLTRLQFLTCNDEDNSSTKTIEEQAKEIQKLKNQPGMDGPAPLSPGQHLEAAIEGFRAQSVRLSAELEPINY